MFGGGSLLRKGFRGIVLLVCIGAVSSLRAQSAHETKAPGVPSDWSHRHLLFTSQDSAQANAEHPRILLHQVARTPLNNFLPEGSLSSLRRNPPPPKKTNKLNTDWQFTIKHEVVANMYPAKYSFLDPTQASCSDFVVYATNWTGAGEPNLVGLTNLYSGPANSSCPTASPGTNATLLFAYTIGQPNITSAVLSLDGTKFAWVENSNPAIFHVMKWGTTGNNGSADLANGNVTPAPDIGTSNNAQIWSVTLTGSTGDSLSSPYVDYDTDTAYVGSDNGILYKVSGVFLGAPALAQQFTVIAGSKLTGPVWSGLPLQRIFVGAANGRLYSVAANLGSATSVVVGDGTTFGGIVDPPIVDASNGFVYVFSGRASLTVDLTQRATVAQMPTSVAGFVQGSLRAAFLGNGNAVNIHAGAFNDAYFNSPTSSSWYLWVCGMGGGGGGSRAGLYRIGFNASRQMNTGTPGDRFNLSNKTEEECSPLTEFRNPNLTAPNDRLYLSLVTSQVLESFNLDGTGTGVNGAGMVNGTLNSSSQITGTSGIIVDNQVMNGQQGSSIYFTNLGYTTSCNGHPLHCAVKLTQQGLN